MPNHHKDNALTFEPCSRAYLGVSGAKKKKVLSMIFSAHGIALVSSIKKNIMTVFSLMDTMSILLGCLTSAFASSLLPNCLTFYFEQLLGLPTERGNHPTPEFSVRTNVSFKGAEYPSGSGEAPAM